MTDTKNDKEIITQPSRKKGVVAYDENPFWEPSEIKIGQKQVRVAGGHHVSDDGETLNTSGIHVVQHVDKDEFVKLYTKNVKAIFDLKPTSQRVLQFLMVALQKTPNADSVYLPWITAEKYFSELDLDVSRTSFHRALKELLAKGFIAESTQPHMFWFNPNLFFNGNRMTFVREYRVRAEPKEITDQSSAAPMNSGKSEKEKWEAAGQRRLLED